MPQPNGNVKPKRTLLDKWRLVRAAARDSNHLSGGDVAVLIALCDRYGSKHNPDLPPIAGHALLAAMSGRTRRATINSTRQLINTGYISVIEPGAGTRGTKYALNFARGEEDFTTKKNEPSGEEEFTTRGEEDFTTNGASGEEDFTESPLTEARRQAGLTERENDCDAATPPPPAGPVGAAEAVTPGEKPLTGFDELWRAYAYRKGKPEARRAYAKLAPDADLHAAMVESACAWRETWAAQDKPDAPRFTLARWLAREEYECEPPTAYKPKERKAKTADTDKPVTKAKGRVSDVLRIIEAETIGSPFGDYRMRLKLDGPAGEQEHVLKVLTESGPGEDNDVFAVIQRAYSANVDELPGQRLRLEMDGERIVNVIPERAPERLVKITAADIVTSRSGDKKALVAKLADFDGKPEGRIEIVVQSQDADLNQDGKERTSRLFNAAGLVFAQGAKIDDWVGRGFTLTENGDFKPTRFEAAA